MANELKPDQEEQYEEAFKLFDRDGDGKITTDELGTVMRSLGACPTETTVQEIIAEIDPQGTGLVEYPVFRDVMIKHKDTGLTEDEVRDAFRVFDKEGKGMIAASELRHVMTTIGGKEKLSNEEADEMIKEANVDANGMINYIEFSKKLVQF
mmetsp:Transcript_2545/g.7612  ORF Transcript_2545/g.7612 Transcript_2545/m.7612 type:complete len:152 (+) Transcript_2545:101-556(+)|eukprot:CAMPEP_0198723978 /NCGR_PEP_ID=MMETSP1475-20131203/1482_1 /TAXON_ID= ORGANISM="Unidentified sp., Strain CCMP1999" /NCGR_SAMPLE_ID=MMETSP1475 /ASSEMBLY_ACC=CAM_ASM_001111 /LENGTH=151 /DNA_ID=CAMNT_0044485333 /DNA_START=66 /DNA_END=521 /DNA_ORIENTATION=-